MTAGPRAWTPAERSALLGLRPMLTPLVIPLAQRRAPSRLVAG